MRVNLSLVENTPQIEKMIVRELHQQLARLVTRVADDVRTPIAALVKNRIMSQPEVQSLINGKLRAEFGVPDGAERMEAIIDHWAANIQTSFKKKNQYGRKVEYSFQISMIQENYNDVIALAEANVRISDGSLPWLEWLLKFGDKIIVRDYDVAFVHSTDAKSRTGTAVMVKGPNRQWGVPPEFSGTEGNNFVTRALDGADEDILDLLEESMRREI